MASNSVTRVPNRTVEYVPSSLFATVPIFRAAFEIENENPRVALLCRFYAFEKAHRMDLTSSGWGVPQFKIYQMNKLEMEKELTENQPRRNDARELQSYCQAFYEKRIWDGECTRKPEEEMAKNVQIATVLYEVVKSMVAAHLLEEKTKTYAAYVENSRRQYEHYNILSSHAFGVKPTIIELPEGLVRRRKIKSCFCFGGWRRSSASSWVLPYL